MGTMLAATAIIVTASTAALASAAARPIAADGPPVPSDGPALPMGRPPAPVFPRATPVPAPLQSPGSPQPTRSAEPAATEAKPASSVHQPAAEPGEPNLTRPSKATRLDHEFVTDVLRARGIEWRSTGNCSNREKPTCTSFDGLRWETLDGLLRFARQSDCEITVTGGTERGHASGQYSHYNGYKIDIATGACVDREIEGYEREGVRGDGAKLYRSPEGGLYARESDHWDITYT